MGKERELPAPTPAELKILQVLWKRGPSTVRDVHDGLPDGRDTGYTTTLKILQILTEKGLVTRDEAARAHLYTARLSQEQSQRRMVNDLVERAFGGAAQKLVMHALASRKASPQELAEIRKLLDNMEEHDR
jgi:predicted transcriptional regulator